MLLQLDDLIRENFEVEPRWDQKLYVAYRVGNFNWIYVGTQASALTLDVLARAHTFGQSELAGRLGLEEFDPESTLADKLSLPSSVLVENRSESTDRVRLRLKEGLILGSKAFIGFLRNAYKAFPKQPNQ